jgi:hypothetical protein
VAPKAPFPSDGPAVTPPEASRAKEPTAAWAITTLVIAAGCGGRYASADRPQCPPAPAKVAPSAVAVANANAPDDAGIASLPKRFYVAAAGQCSEWVVSGGMAENTRQGPLGEVVLQVPVQKGAAGLVVGNHYRRIGPLERIQDRLEAMECYSCFLERDPLVAYAWRDCSPARAARWYADRTGCSRDAALLESSPDSGSLGGWEFRNGVTCELSAENARAGDEEDEAAEGEANRPLESALAMAQKRMRSFQQALAQTRHVFVRRSEGCQAWDLRQDADSPSGWISRVDRIEPGRRQLSEFRFAATPDGVELAGWIETTLPSSKEPSGEISYGPTLCEEWTTLSDVSDSRAKFMDQVWFFSRAACEKGAGEESDGFGPTLRFSQCVVARTLAP